MLTNLSCSLFIGISLSAYTVLQAFVWRVQSLVYWLTNFFSLQKRRLITHANAKSKSEKFPPPHQDGALGYPLGCSNHMEPAFEPPDPSSFSTVFPYEKGVVPTCSGPLADSAAGNQKRKHKSGRSSKQPSTARARWYIISCLVGKKYSILKKKNTLQQLLRTKRSQLSHGAAAMNELFFLRSIHVRIFSKHRSLYRLERELN